MPSCLVIKTSSFGDIYQTLLTVLTFKKQNPTYKITWVVEKNALPLYFLFSEIDHVIVCDFKNWKKHPFANKQEFKEFFQKLKTDVFDLALDFQANSKSALILQACKALKKVSFDKSQVAEWPHRLLNITRLKVVDHNFWTFYGGLVQIESMQKKQAYPLLHKNYELIVDVPQKHIIMLGLGSMWSSKQLTLEQAKDLLALLSEKFDAYFLIPAQESEEKQYQSLLVGYQGRVLRKNAISDYIPYMLKTNLFVGVDSALLHLARLLGVASRGFFGPSSKNFYGEPLDIQGACPYEKTFLKRCDKLRKCSGPCIKSLSLKDESSFAFLQT